LAEAKDAIVVTSDARLVQKASDAGIGRFVVDLATFNPN
jgi:predicted nucleic acid-binding protein